MKKILLMIGILPSLIIGMDDAAAKAERERKAEMDSVWGIACLDVRDAKLKKYKEKLATKFKQLEELVSDPQKIEEELKKRPLNLLYTKEKYAPLLQHLLQYKKIDANFEWTENFHRMMCSCSAQFNLLGIALQSKAIQNAKLLVEYGASVDGYCNDLNRSYTSIFRSLAESVRLNDPHLVKAVLTKKPDLKNPGRAVAEFPLSIALARVCSEQNGEARDNAWNIVQALSKAGADHLEPGQRYHEQSVTLSDCIGKYTIIPNNPLEIIITYNHYANNGLAYVETFLTGRSNPMGLSTSSYREKVAVAAQNKH